MKLSALFLIVFLIGKSSKSIGHLHGNNRRMTMVIHSRHAALQGGPAEMCRNDRIGLHSCTKFPGFCRNCCDHGTANAWRKFSLAFCWLCFSQSQSWQGQKQNLSKPFGGVAPGAELLINRQTSSWSKKLLEMILYRHTAGPDWFTSTCSLLKFHYLFIFPVSVHCS